MSLTAIARCADALADVHARIAHRFARSGQRDEADTGLGEQIDHGGELTLTPDERGQGNRRRGVRPMRVPARRIRVEIARRDSQGEGASGSANRDRSTARLYRGPRPPATALGIGEPMAVTRSASSLAVAAGTGVVPRTHAPRIVLPHLFRLIRRHFAKMSFGEEVRAA